MRGVYGIAERTSIPKIPGIRRCPGALVLKPIHTVAATLFVAQYAEGCLLCLRGMGKQG